MMVSIVISTKDRLSDLINCLNSCLLLNGIDEILVFDDGSKDNTYDFVKENYPSVSLFRSDESLGLINARIKCASLAKGNIIISVDDDCVFQDTETVNEIVQYFSLPNIAVVTIPCIDVYLNPEVITQCGLGKVEDSIFITTQFRGCAHAMKKDIFLSLGGYYSNLGRQEEETEYGLRLWKAGYIIRIGDCSCPILHYHSSIRNEKLISYFRSRNQFLVNYRLIPLLLLPIFGGKQLIQTFFYEFRNKRTFSFFQGLKDAWIEIVSGRVKRDALSYNSYLKYKYLRSKGRSIYNVENN